jgi:ubiquitin-protein ligase
MRAAIPARTSGGHVWPDIAVALTQCRWNAAWSVATILTGLLSFMLSDE